MNGDQFEQADQRLVLGGSLARRWSLSWNGRAVELAGGLQLRHDQIDNGLYRTRDLARLRTVREDAIGQTSGGPGPRPPSPGIRPFAPGSACGRMPMRSTSIPTSRSTRAARRT